MARRARHGLEQDAISRRRVTAQRLRRGYDPVDDLVLMIEPTILTPRLRQLIAALHDAPLDQHPAIMGQYDSEVLE